MKKIILFLFVVYGLKTSAQLCDSLTYWVDQSQGFDVGLDTSNITNSPDSMEVWWGACTNGVCYAGQGMNYYFSQITPTDTVKLNYDVYIYINGLVEVCSIEDWLIFDGNNWVIYNMNTVGIKEHKDKIGINKMYDLYGREILRPNGFYIRNNKLFYE
tara:strand:- start:471 stop:944 length:474 start_codon:yes stop_codon:yes gene_type:complete